MKPTLVYHPLFTTACLLAACVNVHADDLTWDGSIGNWDTDASWLPGGLEPTALDTVTIDSGGEVTVDQVGEEAFIAYVGVVGSGKLILDHSGVLNTQLTGFGQDPGSTGTGVLRNGASLISANGVRVGRYGHGSLTVESGATVSVIDYESAIGSGVGSVGSLTVTGSSSTFSTPDFLYVGRYDGSQGAVLVEAGGVVNADIFVMAYNNSLSSSTLVTGAGSQLNVSTLTIGNGTLAIEDGAHVQAGWGRLSSPTGTSRVTVAGVGSRWDITNYRIEAGGRNDGYILIEDGAVVTSIGATIGEAEGLYAEATVTGTGSALNISEDLWIASRGTGVVNVLDGATLTAGSVRIGTTQYKSAGEVTVSGSGSSMTVNGDLSVGESDTGVLNIGPGNVVEVAGRTWIGESALSNGTLNLDQATLNTTAFIALKEDLQGTGIINTHGLITDRDLVIDSVSSLQQSISINSLPGQNITVNINAGSTNPNSVMGAGYRGTGSLTVRNGQTIRSGEGYIGHIAGADGTVTITGPGSSWLIDGHLAVGFQTRARLNIEAGGVVESQSAYLGRVIPSSIFDTTIANITGPGSKWMISDWLEVGGIQRVNYDLWTLNVLDSGLLQVGNTIRIREDGTLNLNGGAIIADTVEHTDGGKFYFSDGTLSVGTFIGDLNQQSGTLAPVSAGHPLGITTVTGGYTNDAGTLAIDLGIVHDQVAVQGQLSLGTSSTLDLSFVPGFIPQLGDVFQVIDYTTRTGEFASVQGVNDFANIALAVTYDDTVGAVFVTAANPGDADLDGDIDTSDITSAIIAFTGAGGTGGSWSTGDFDGDGDIDTSDITSAIINFTGASAANEITLAQLRSVGAEVYAADLGIVPEPSSLALFGLGGLLFARRRR